MRHHCPLRSCLSPETWNPTVAGATTWMVTPLCLAALPCSASQSCCTVLLYLTLCQSCAHLVLCSTHAPAPRASASSFLSLLCPRRVFTAFRFLPNLHPFIFLGKLTTPPRQRPTCRCGAQSSCALLEVHRKSPRRRRRDYFYNIEIFSNYCFISIYNISLK